jgi:hypothetical protein
VDASLPQTDVALTALAALALEHAQPDSPLAAEGLRWIAAQRPVRGWPGGYESARAVIALASALPTTPAEYTVRLGADRLLAGGVSDTGPGDVALALADLPDAPTLDVLSAGRVLISYRVTLPAGDQAPAGDDSLLREYLDPLSGERLEEGALRAGQLVRVRLTLVTGGARAFASVEEPLPAGLTLVDPGQGGWGHVARRGDRLVLTSALLAPGVHEHSYLVRASLPGRYAAPAPLARGPGGAIIGAGRGVELTVIGP